MASSSQAKTGASGAQLKEGTAINASLTALGKRTLEGKREDTREGKAYSRGGGAMCAMLAFVCTISIRVRMICPV
jgi:hypothetical protein